MNDKYIPKSKNKRVTRGDILPAERIFQVVQEYFDISREYLLTKSKKIQHAYPRQIVSYFLDKYSYHNRTGIAFLLGWKDANSTHEAIQALGNYLATDEIVRDQVAEIEKILMPCPDTNCM
jgi:chromosomal replication initiation ATPase DnaA